jgi:sugar O-acyltransferase (sialic acid O-acetyltransferase NeuD family)
MNKSSSVAVIGAGGHGKVVVSTLRALGYTAITLYDDDSCKWGRDILGAPVAGPIVEVRQGRHELGVMGIGDNSLRRRLARRIPLAWLPLVHPAAHVHPSVELGAGAVIFAGAVIQPETVIGSHVIVNTGATVDHDCTLESFSHLAPGVHLCGGVYVGEGALLAVGSSAVPNVRIGAWATIGAGGVVVEDLPNEVVAVGLPAKPR